MDFNDNDNLKKILKGSDTAEIDRECMESGIDSGWLMNNAGTCVSDFILDCYRKKEFVFGSGQNAVGKTGRVKTCKSKSVLKLKGCILCGTGNNGGDGFVCALNLLKKGMDLTLFCSGFQEKLKGDSLFYYRKLLEIKEKPDPRTDKIPGSIKIFFPENGNEKDYLAKLENCLLESDFAVDALFGTGLHNDIRGRGPEIIDLVNRIRKSKKELIVFAVDIPSGIDSDDGKILGKAIKADHTITFGTKKTGHVIYPGSEYSGKVIVTDIGIPDSILKKHDGCFEATLKWVAEKLPDRGQYSYKHSVGKLLVIAGSRGFTGAAAMTCQAAIRAGAGIVTLVCPVELNEIFEIKLTEEMTYPVEQTDAGSLHLNSFREILNESKKYDGLAIGPGLSRNPSTVMLVREILKNIKIPTVLDADGLRALAAPLEIQEDALFNLENVIITPHPGELCSILSKEKINPEERIASNRESSEKFGVVSVLKGSSTIITYKKDTFINPTGDFALATAGTGDILTGIIGAFLCQGMDRLSAAVCGTYIHGLASDFISICTGKTSMIATDLLEGLKKVFLEIEKLKY
ncbi:MAG TPA: NAD(P)H-hydrate dehydratase [Actinobacteria bacterium]|nr:NAD(P)H-hydrate dehydratase [Actinomycetota bacterium]